MASNADYAQAIVQYAREKAESDGHADLLPLAQRLETLVSQIPARARQRLIDSASLVLRSGPVSASGRVEHAGWSAHAPSSGSARDELSTRYFGRLR